MKNSRSSKNINGEKFVVVMNSHNQCEISFTLKAISKTFKIDIKDLTYQYTNLESIIRYDSFADVYDYMATELSEITLDKLIKFIDITVNRFALRYKGDQNANF